MKKYFYIITMLLCSLSLISQSEMIITEMNSDDDAVIEIAGENPTDTSYTQMTLGFNRSNHGWLRTKTDHDLSLWTNNIKRFTVKNTGDIGIGTSSPLERLFILNGRLGLETKTLGTLNTSESTGINFYTGSASKASITYCDCPADGGDLMSFNQPENGYFNFKAGGQSKMIINRDGSVKINDLEGAGQRIVYAEGDGTLKTSDNVQYKVVKGTHFQKVVFSDGELEYYDERGAAYGQLGADFGIGDDEATGISHPDIPYTKFEIEEIKITYFDNSTSNLTFKYDGPGANEVAMKTTGADLFIRNLTLPINQIIDQEQGQTFSISIEFTEEVNQSFCSAKIKYRPVY